MGGRSRQLLPPTLPPSNLKKALKGGENLALIRCKCSAKYDDILDQCPFCKLKLMQALQPQEHDLDIGEIAPTGSLFFCAPSS